MASPSPSQSQIPETQPSHEALDAQILSVRTQIQALTSRSSTLRAAILTNPTSTQSLLSHHSSSRATSHHQALKTLINSHAHLPAQSLHRLCTPATLFASRAPDPHALDGGRLVGIRLESYNALTRKFETPYYVLLQRVQGSRNSDGERDREGQGERDEDEEEEDAPLRVHRHTLPPYIPLQNLVSKYLPLPSATQPSKRQKQDLGRFVRALRFEVVARSRRMEAVERLKENVEGRGGERGVRSVQAERQGGEIRVEWVDGVKAKIEVAERGDVVEVEVLGTDGRRERGLEGRILGRRVEDLEGLLGG